MRFERTESGLVISDEINRISASENKNSSIPVVRIAVAIVS